MCLKSFVKAITTHFSVNMCLLFLHYFTTRLCLTICHKCNSHLYCMSDIYIFFFMFENEQGSQSHWMFIFLYIFLLLLFFLKIVTSDCEYIISAANERERNLWLEVGCLQTKNIDVKCAFWGILGLLITTRLMYIGCLNKGNNAICLFSRAGCSVDFFSVAGGWGIGSSLSYRKQPWIWKSLQM